MLTDSQDSGRTWSVVKFPNEGSVEAVPTTWIFGNKCFWPPYSRSKIRIAIEQHHPADVKTWVLHEVCLLKNSVFGNSKQTFTFFCLLIYISILDDYNVAKKKTQLATFKSDLESQSDADAIYSSKKRKIIRKVHSFYSSEEDVEDHEVSFLPCPPPLTKGKRRHVF